MYIKLWYLGSHGYPCGQHRSPGHTGGKLTKATRIRTLLYREFGARIGQLLDRGLDAVDADLATNSKEPADGREARA